MDPNSKKNRINNTVSCTCLANNDKAGAAAAPAGAEHPGLRIRLEKKKPGSNNTEKSDPESDPPRKIGFEC